MQGATVTVLTGWEIPQSRRYFTHQGDDHIQRQRLQVVGYEGDHTAYPFVQRLLEVHNVDRVFIDHPNCTNVWLDAFNVNWEAVETEILKLIFADLGLPFDVSQVRWIDERSHHLLKRIDLPRGGWHYWPADDPAPEQWLATLRR